MRQRLDPRLLLQGYAAGIFPMANSRDADEIFWVEPRHRAILPLDEFHLSRSLAGRLRSGTFNMTCDRAFDEVVAACADREETWIDASIEEATRHLHAEGHAHSIECWRGDKLVGGLYGVKLGRAFFGESMFNRSTDASKVALAWLVARMRVGHFQLLDCQFMTDHLASLGAIEVDRARYSALLAAALGTATSGSGASAGEVAASASEAGSAEGELAAGPEDLLLRPEFGALDELLDAAGFADNPAASGQLIAPLLVKTS